jgi:uncharacterized protein (TIGR00255 family)
MIQSMTSFGRSQAKGDWGSAVWEIRSINHRYLEISIRLPEILRELEQSIRDCLHQYFQRGKIECSLRFYPGAKLGSILSINQGLLNQLIEMTTSISKTLPQDQPQLNLIDLLSWNGVVVEESIDINLFKDELIALFKQAASDMKEGRKREGSILAKVVTERVEKISLQVAEIKKYLPAVLTRQRDKILGRLEEAKVSLDPQRLEQEMVYYAQKIDISEELDRTLSHLSEVERSLKQSDSAGRRLDFMMQELNREANTLASKSVDPQITHAAVEMKVLIEQIREQVQNIE